VTWRGGDEVVELSTPRNLLDAVEREGRPWLATLPTIVEQVAEHWSLRVGDPFEPGGQTAWVAPVRGATGAALVLKVAWCHPEAEHEADGLREWDGDGAVRLGQCLEFGLVRPPTTLRGALEPRAGPEPRPYARLQEARRVREKAVPGELVQQRVQEPQQWSQQSPAGGHAGKGSHEARRPSRVALDRSLRSLARYARLQESRRFKEEAILGSTANACPHFRYSAGRQASTAERR